MASPGSRGKWIFEIVHRAQYHSPTREPLVYRYHSIWHGHLPLFLRFGQSLHEKLNVLVLKVKMIKQSSVTLIRIRALARAFR